MPKILFPTSPATATTSIKIGVDQIVWMPLRTMRKATMNSCWPYTAKNIDFISDRFKMFRIYTTHIPAQMVKGQSLRDNPRQQFVSEVVGMFSAPIHPYRTVPIAVTSCPQPTRRIIPKRAVLINLLPESLLHWWFSWLPLVDSCRHKQTAFYQHAAATRRVGCRRLCGEYTTW